MYTTSLLTAWPRTTMGEKLYERKSRNCRAVNAGDLEASKLPADQYIVFQM